LAALVAEIGPPEDFSSWRQLMRYAGLNLTEQQSGKWRGQTTISRRGRSEIRYMLNKIAWPLMRRGQLFDDYYWKKREVDRMPGNKAMTAVMRKVLKMFYGWSRSEAEFDHQRVFVMNVSLEAVA
jgi:transposase